VSFSVSVFQQCLSASVSFSCVFQHQCQRIIFNSNKQHISVTGNVTLVTVDFSISARGLSASHIAVLEERY